MLAVIYYDVTRYLIPNWLVGLVLLLYPAMVLLAPEANIDWQKALAASAMVFAVGYLIFMLRAMGGGDIKLMTACSLWAGMEGLLEYFLAVAVAGGLLSVVLLILRPVMPQWLARLPGERKIPRVLTMGEPVPYGLAIAVAFLWMLWAGKLPGLPALV